jgi:hypothetical protein
MGDDRNQLVPGSTAEVDVRFRRPLGSASVVHLCLESIAQRNSVDIAAASSVDHLLLQL